MAVEIHVQKRTFIQNDNEYVLELTGLATSIGIAPEVFVFEYHAGADDEFNHIANVVDMANLSTTPAVGSPFYRLTFVTFVRENAWEIEELSNRIFEDITALQENAQQVADDFGTDQNFRFADGSVVSYTV